MIRLPISGASAAWRASTGYDDMAVADCRAGLAEALTCVNRCVVDADGSPVDGAALPVGDLDLLVVARRRDLLGDAFVAEGQCARCAATVDVRFGLAAYAEHNRPRVPRGAFPEEDGWWALPRQGISVRVPTAGDVLAAWSRDSGRAEFVERCVRGEAAPAAVRAAEKAMASLGPTLRSDVAGTCPECGAGVVLDVDARELCLTELRFLASSVYDDVHLIATAYGWTEDGILDLPSGRRRRYADLISGNVRSEVPPELVDAGLEVLVG
jgi:hypothetical protein